MSETVERFGDHNTPAYQRGEITPAEPGERMVDMECCAFRFSATHTDTDREGYTCPCCAPRGVQMGAPEKKTEHRDAIYELAATVERLEAELADTYQGNRPPCSICGKDHRPEALKR